MKNLKVFTLILFLFLEQNIINSQTFRWNDLSNNVPCITMTMLTNVKYFNNKLFITNGNIGRLYISSDHGNSFETKNIDTIYDGFYNIQIKNESKIWLLRANDNVLFESNNGGNNWITKGSIGYNFNTNKICFINDLTGYFIGYDNNMGGHAYIIKTTNGGYNFINMGLPQSYFGGTDIAIPDTLNLNIIYAAFYSTTGGSIWKSTNSGVNWLSMNSIGSASRFTFLSSNKAWACGYNGNIYYFDGNNWTQQSSGVIQRIDCISFCNDGLHGWAGGPGSTIIKTSNGGQNWIKDSTTGTNVWFYDICAVSPTEAYAVGGPKIFMKYGVAVGINKISSEIPEKFYLSQNYPNPFNPNTKISYKVESYKVIKLVVYDILGKEVTMLVNEKQKPGTYEVTFDGSNLSSGLYFYTLSTDNFKDTKKLILLK